MRFSWKKILTYMEEYERQSVKAQYEQINSVYLAVCKVLAGEDGAKKIAEVIKQFDEASSLEINGSKQQK